MATHCCLHPGCYVIVRLPVTRCEEHSRAVVSKPSQDLQDKRDAYEAFKAERAANDRKRAQEAKSRRKFIMDAEKEFEALKAFGEAHPQFKEGA